MANRTHDEKVTHERAITSALETLDGEGDRDAVLAAIPETMREAVSDHWDVTVRALAKAGEIRISGARDAPHYALRESRDNLRDALRKSVDLRR